MGTYTPNYNLYMPEVGETGWGNLVSNNFEIIDNAIGSGTRTITLTENSPDFQQYWDGNIYVTYINDNYIMTESITPSQSARLCLIICNGNLTISGNLDTYPTSVRYENPPNSTSTNTYSKTVSNYNNTVSFTYTKSNNTATLSVSKTDLKSFLNAINSVNYTLSIPAATTLGTTDTDGASGTASNTCNGAGGGYTYHTNDPYTGGTGCIFGQYAGGVSSHRNGYGYGDVRSAKYRCGLVIIAFGNLTITSTITQIGGNGSITSGGYGGGALYSGGGGAPVFIYYSGTYTNNGSINVNGGTGYYNMTNNRKGGAGGIKTTKITI